MCFYIGIKDLAANGLIEMLKVDRSRRFLSYKKIESYGNKVVRSLNESGESAVLILSREDTSELFRNYSEFFEEVKDSSGVGRRIEGDANGKLFFRCLSH